MHGRSFFMEGAFNGHAGQGVQPITLAINSYEIPQDELKDVLKRAMPQGWTGTSPQVVKALDGEWLVYADGSAQFVPLGRSAGERFYLGGSMFGRGFLGDGSPLRMRSRLGAIELIELGSPRRKMGQPQPGLVCCTPADGGPSPCVDTNYQGTGKCAVVWADASNTQHPPCGPDGLPQVCSQPAQPPPPPPPAGCPPGQVEQADGSCAPPAATGEECPAGQAMSPWGCMVAAIACPDDQGTYTVVEVDPAGGGGFQPTGRVLATGVSHGELQSYAHVVTMDDPRCGVTPSPVEPPLEEPTPVSEEPPPAETPAVACPEGDVYDLFDSVTGALVSSGVPASELPEGAEIVAVDDPRCGVPAPAPSGAQAGPGAPLPGGLPGEPLPGRVPLKPSPQPGPFPQSVTPCGGVAYGVQDLALVTQEQTSPADFDPRYRTVN